MEFTNEVILTKQFMRKKVIKEEGYILVKPNFRDRDEFDSYHLSPKKLGPVITPVNKKGLFSSALNLENFHQGNKIYACELDYSELIRGFKTKKRCCGYYSKYFFISLSPCTKCERESPKRFLSNYLKVAMDGEEFDLTYSDKNLSFFSAVYRIGKKYDLDIRIAIAVVRDIVGIEGVNLTKRQLEVLTEYFPLQDLWHLPPSNQAFEDLEALYNNPKPYRHKPLNTISLFHEVPVYSIWLYIKKDKLYFRRYDYLGSRQFYCSYYEKLAQKGEAKKVLKKLRDLVSKGYYLQISGYDAYNPFEIHTGSTSKVLEKAYLDTSRPFGHELVLLCLLILSKGDYPWRKYITEEL